MSLRLCFRRNLPHKPTQSTVGDCTGCGVANPRRPSSVRAVKRDDQDVLEWRDFFGSVDSDDLALPGFPLGERKRNKRTSLGNCYGCGVKLQTEQPNTPGFIELTASEKKLQHKQKNTLLCARCRALAHGEMVPAVQDFSQQQTKLLDSSSSTKKIDTEIESTGTIEPNATYMFKGEQLITPEQLRQKLEVIRTTKAVCVMIVDILDTSGSFISRIRNLIGRNPVIVVATKVDLLPKGTNYSQIHDWLKNLVAFKKLNCLSVHLVSNKTGDGMDAACTSILSQRLGRDVYIVGAANVGKSAFVRRMLKEMTSMTSRHFDPKATIAGKKLPMESAMPGTTLGLLKLGAFSSGGSLYDTPGLHLHHRMLHILTPAELKAIHPKRRLRSYVAASPLAIAEQADMLGASSHDQWTAPSTTPSCTYLWGALLRIDVLEAPPDAHFVFFGTGMMQVYACRLMGEFEVLDFEAGACNGEKAGREEPNKASSEAFGAASAVARGGLRVSREVELNSAGFTTSLADVTMSGMPGWVSVVSNGMPGVARLRLWAPKGVEVNLRPPIPCPTPVASSYM